MQVSGFSTPLQDWEMLHSLSSPFSFNSEQEYFASQQACCEAILKACHKDQWKLIEAHAEAISKVRDVFGRTILMQAVSHSPIVSQLLKYNIHLGEYKEIPVFHSYWVLMTRDVLEGTRDKNYSKQAKIVTEFRQKSGLPYEVPHLLDAAVCIFMIHASTGIKLYGQNPWTYTHCQEAYSKDYQLSVGCFFSRRPFCRRPPRRQRP